MGGAGVASGVGDSGGDGSSLGSVGNLVVPPSAGMPSGEGGDDESSVMSLRSDWSQPRKSTRAFCRLMRAPRKRAIAAQVRAANEGGYHKQLVTIGCMVNKCCRVCTLQLNSISPAAPDRLERQLEASAIFVKEMVHLHFLCVSVGEEFVKTASDYLGPSDTEGLKCLLELNRYFPMSIVNMKDQDH